MKFSIKVFFSKCDKIRRKLRIWSHLLKKSLMENFIFCAVSDTRVVTRTILIKWFPFNNLFKIKLRKISQKTKKTSTYKNFCMYSLFSLVKRSCLYWANKKPFKITLGQHKFLRVTAWKLFKYGIWSVFSCIQSKYRKIRTRKNSLFGHF